ncbi:MAG TPA: hypothetical protein VMA32_15850 [Streptosporangiaceae bacterium]|nr:hypothetical protein [Streptosporangiaceae bacterium]
MQDLKVIGLRTQPTGQGRRRRLRGDSLLWLVLVSVLFLAAELTPPLLRMPLGADEITYIARTSVHPSLISLPPVHGQGVGLLAAPVTLLTNSLLAIRIWMSLLSATGLFLAMLCWRGLRPIWVLALAELILASLAITQNSGVQIYPDWWGALGVLALTGLFLHAVNATMSDRVVLPLIAVAGLLIALMRPQNVVFLMGPAILAALVVRRWRKPKVLAAMGIGVAAGFLEWLAGAYLWFGGLSERIQLAGQEPPPLHLYFALGTQVRYLNGPWYCTPPYCNSWAVWEETPWWVAFLAAAAIGVWVAWRTKMKASSVLAAATAVWVFVLYAFLVPFGAPRYLLPTFALMAILAADAIVWAVTESRRKKLAAIVACVFVLGGIASQREILQHQIADQDVGRQFQAQAAELRKMGIHAPCAMVNTSIAWYLGCSAPWTTNGTNDQVMDWFLEHRTPPGLKRWEVFEVPATAANVTLFGTELPVIYVPVNTPLPPHTGLIKAKSAMYPPTIIPDYAALQQPAS